jgi:hypothetical protein
MSALAAALCALMIGVGGAVPVAAAEILSGDQIWSALAGNTVEGAMEATGAYVEFYDPAGVVRGKDYQGRWTIEGNSMCFEYTGSPKECWQVGRDNGAIEWLQGGEVYGMGRLVPGNPNGF